MLLLSRFPASCFILCNLSQGGAGEDIAPFDGSDLDLTAGTYYDAAAKTVVVLVTPYHATKKILKKLK
jgi:hypothetical protein